MLLEQSFQLPDERKKFATREGIAPLLEDHEYFKATIFRTGIITMSS
jgi:hypothetical protein